MHDGAAFWHQSNNMLYITSGIWDSVDHFGKAFLHNCIFHHPSKTSLKHETELAEREMLFDERKASYNDTRK
jgi:hypothetical protein